MTVKELSLQLGISSQAIYSRAAKEGIQLQTIQTEGKRRDLTEDTIKAVMNLYAASPDEEKGKLREQVIALTKQVESLTADKTSLSAQVAKLEQVCEILRAQLTDKEDELRRAQKRFDNLQDKIINRLEASRQEQQRLPWYKRIFR